LPWPYRMTLIALAFVALPYIFVSWRLIKALKILLPQYQRRVKRLVIGSAIFLNLLPVFVVVTYLTGSSSRFIYGTEVNFLDILVVFPFWLGFLTIFESFFYFILFSIIDLVISKRINENKIIWQRRFSAIKIIFIILMFCNVLIVTAIDTYTVKTTEFNAVIEKLPSELDGLKIALVGDLQIDRFTQETKIKAFYDALNQSNPDLLLFAGDLVTRGTFYIPQGLNVLCDTKANIERIACVGDHDIWSNAQQISRGLVNCGWIFLDNQHHLTGFQGKQILITGVTYVYSRRSNPDRLKQLLGDAPTADVKILLVHQPSRLVIDFARQYGYHIMLAGHTHGGQIVFKPFGLTLTPTMFENNYYSGFFLLDKLNLFITNGIGLTMIPLRYRAPAEIQQITLRKN